jgi:hypothetical protein
MALHKPPLYRYAFYDPWDKYAYDLIRQLAKAKRFPKLIGSRADKNQFLITLIRTQKALHGWRRFLKDTLAQIEKSNAIDTRTLIQQFPPKSIATNKPAWVTYHEDEVVSNFIDDLAKRKIDFIGSDRAKSEFVLRFILGQLGHDWEWTIMMIWEILGRKNQIRVTKLNKELTCFDHGQLFK